MLSQDEQAMLKCKESREEQGGKPRCVAQVPLCKIFAELIVGSRTALQEPEG